MNTQRNTIAFRFMIIGLFMAVLDIQVVASSIGELKAALMASADEISTVQTAYLMAEVVMIPMCGWLSDALSTRHVFCISAAVFTLASLGCAMATGLSSMIACRIVQGFFGGAMIPTVFSSIYLLFPEEQRTKATIQAGMAATLAPTLGPTLGGWISTHLSWHWLFLINLLPGIIVTLGVYRTLRIDRPQYQRLKALDWPGMLLIAIALSALELFLREGPKHEWLQSSWVLGLLVTMVASLVLLVIRELNYHEPIVYFPAFLDRHFTMGCLLSFAIGSGLYGAVYLLPVTLSVIRGYNSLQIGHIMFFAGLFQLFSGPVAGLLEGRLSRRAMLGCGMLVFATSLLLNSDMSDHVNLNTLLIPQILRGFSIMFCFLPMTAIALGHLPPERVKQASGLYNLMRNLGGAVGIAMIDTQITRQQHHSMQALAEGVTAQHLAHLPARHWPLGVDMHQASTIKVTLLHHLMMQKAYLMAFNRSFFSIGLLMLIMGVCVFALKPSH